jgi:hypothetical protein
MNVKNGRQGDALVFVHGAVGTEAKMRYFEGEDALDTAQKFAEQQLKTAHFVQVYRWIGWSLVSGETGVLGEKK